MTTKYQLVLAGFNNKFKDSVVQTFSKRVADLGLEESSINILDENNFTSDYQRTSPTVGLYFGEKADTFPNIDILDKLIIDSAFVIPVVPTEKDFTEQVPELLFPINGFRLESKLQIESLVSCALECLGLLRLARRLFISYRRNESRNIAIQLYEQLEQAGFDVFLDTHSIRPGDIFQDELWHRLVDTDVVVLLNTPGFLESEWTSEELSKASAKSIGILQLIWPDHSSPRFADLAFTFKLNENDFRNEIFNTIDSQLEPAAIDRIISEIESIRARSLASRQDNIIKEFQAAAKSLGIIANLQPEKYITFNRRDGKEVIALPTIGVPRAFTYNQTIEIIERIKLHKTPEAYLIYDHRNIRKKWLNHLSWLNEYLPVKSIKITEIEEWLKKI